MFVVEDNPKSMEAESYRILRTNIQYSSIDKEVKSIVITSACPGEGKSTITGNLALTFAMNGKKVLIIDCDLRKPTIHSKFNLSNICGLSEVMIGKESLYNAIQKYKSNLYILTSGNKPPNPAEMINSTSMSILLEQLKEEYDIIIIDSPPLGVVTDTQVLSTKVDGTIIVFKVGISKTEYVQEAKNLLNKVGANIIGLVMNQISDSKRKYEYYYK